MVLAPVCADFLLASDFLHISNAMHGRSNGDPCGLPTDDRTSRIEFFKKEKVVGGASPEPSEHLSLSRSLRRRSRPRLASGSGSSTTTGHSKQEGCLTRWASTQNFSHSTAIASHDNSSCNWKLRCLGVTQKAAQDSPRPASPVPWDGPDVRDKWITWSVGVMWIHVCPHHETTCVAVSFRLFK